MKFKKIYMFGGEYGKADPTDYVDYYEAENGMKINIHDSITNPQDRYYTVNGYIFFTLREAKEYCAAK